VVVFVVMIVEVDLTIVVVTAVLVDVDEHVPVVLVTIDVVKMMLVGAQVQMLVIDEVASDVVEERASAVDVPLWEDNIDGNEEACERVDDSREAEDSELVEDRKEVEASEDVGRSEDTGKLELENDVEGVDSDKV